MRVCYLIPICICIVYISSIFSFVSACTYSLREERSRGKILLNQYSAQHINYMYRSTVGKYTERTMYTH